MPFDEHIVNSEVAGSSLRRMSEESGLLSAGRESYLFRAAPSWSKDINLSEVASKKTSNPLKVSTPINSPNYPGRNGSRYTSRARDDDYGAKLIAMAHQTESIVAQATNKFTDLINKKGFSLRSLKKEPELYLKARLEFLGRCIKESIPHQWKELSRDFVAQGNAYLVKVYEKYKTLIIKGHTLKTATSLHGDPSRGVISGYFRVDPRHIEPKYDKRSGKHNGWIHKTDDGRIKTFTLDDIIHLPYQKPAGEILGISMHKPVLDDIRALRDQEEYAIKLFEKMLFPIVHHEVPPHGDDSMGTQEEMDQAAYGYSGIAPDGILITPPGHKINVIGAAGEALNPTPQLEYMRARIFMGEGLSGTIMGIDSSSAGTSDVLTTQMHDRVKSFQQDIQEIINLHIIYELLLEAGYDPTLEEETVWLEFNEIEDEARIRAENHATLQFTNGVLSEDEARAISKLNPFTPAERKKKQIYTDQIPVIEAETAAQKELTSHEHDETRETAEHGHKLNKDLATHTHKINKDAISHDANTQKDLVKSGVAPSATQQVRLAGIKATSDIAKSNTPKTPKIKTSRTRTSGAKKAVANKANPSNQHGSRGVARASKTPAAGAASKRTPNSAK